MTDKEKAEFWAGLASWRNQTTPYTPSRIAEVLASKGLSPGAYQQGGRDEPDKYVKDDATGTWSPVGGGYSTGLSPSQGAQEYGTGWGSINPSGTDKGWTEEQVRQEMAYRARQLPGWAQTALGGVASLAPLLTGPFTAAKALKAGVGALVGDKVKGVVSGLFGKDTDKELQKRLEYFTLQPARQQEAALTGPLSDDYSRSGGPTTMGRYGISQTTDPSAAALQQRPWHPDVSDLYDVWNPLQQKPPSTAALPRNVAERLVAPQRIVETGTLNPQTFGFYGGESGRPWHPDVSDLYDMAGQVEPAHTLTVKAGLGGKTGGGYRINDLLGYDLEGNEVFSIPQTSTVRGPSLVHLLPEGPFPGEENELISPAERRSWQGRSGVREGPIQEAEEARARSMEQDPRQEHRWMAGGGMVNPRPMMGGIGGRGEVLRRMFRRAI